MRHAIILAQSRPTATALGAWWNLAGSNIAQTSRGDHDFQPCDEPLYLVCEQNSQKTIDTFRYLATKISLVIEEKTSLSDSIVVLVDHVDPAQLNPLESNWSALIAMLILAFPDLDWYFGTIRSSSNENGFPYNSCGLTALLEPEKDSLFDYNGLRHWIRSRIADTKEDGKPLASHLPRRGKLAIAIDDERAYAYLHAYAAYRFGFRALPVTGERIADQWLSEKSDYEKPFLTLEDLFLNFPDRRDNSESLSDLDDRDNRWKALKSEEIGFRIFVTSGQRHSGDEQKRERNRGHMGEPHIKCGQYRRRALKPTGGIFDLWHQTKLNRKKRLHDGELYIGVGPGYIWPPRGQRAIIGDTGHSAPGRLLTISEYLLARCDHIMKQGVHSVEEAVHGAVLAGNALELLGDRTPTTAIQALRMKHQFEVLAECQFSGIEYHLLVKPRLKEIRKEVRAIGRWFSRRKRKDATLNAEMIIINSIMGIFREHNQFEEELLCMARARHLNNTLWMRHRGRRLPFPWRYLFWPIMRYSEFLLSSLPRFIFGLTIWTVLLGALFSLADAHLEIGDVPTVHLDFHPVSALLTTFFGVGSLIDTHPIWIMLTLISVLGGFAHLGIFISHLYSIVMRK